jgi:hypothetical protein
MNKRVPPGDSRCMLVFSCGGSLPCEHLELSDWLNRDKKMMKYSKLPWWERFIELTEYVTCVQEEESMLSSRICGNLVVIVVIFRALFLPEDGNSIFSRNVVVHLPHCAVLTEDFINLHCIKKPETLCRKFNFKILMWMALWNIPYFLLINLYF